MNDLKMLNDLGTALDPAEAAPPPRLRNRVVGGFGGPPRRRWRVSRGLTLATSVGFAAVLVVTLVVSIKGGAGTRGTGDLTASEVLLRAASFQRTDTAAAPRADQFVHVQSISAYYSTERPVQPKMREIWWSVDGTHDGVLRESAIPGKPRAIGILENVPLGVAITLSNSVAVTQLIFDPGTYAYLGHQVLALADKNGYIP